MVGPPRVNAQLIRLLAMVLPGAALMIAAFGPLAGAAWVAPRFAFWSLVVITVLCAAGAVVVAAIGWRRRLAEVAILGSLLLAVSVLPLVHALTIPGVLFDANSSTTVAAVLAVPVGVVVAMPLILPQLRISRALASRWRLWSITTICVSIALAAILLAAPDGVPAPRAGHPVALLLVAVSLAGMLCLSRRQLRLYRLGRRRASLLASAAFVYLGLSTLVFLVGEPFTLLWWGAHLADALGVFGAIFGLVLAHHRDRSLVWALAPVVNRDPLIALELGLTPVVHRFIAALERKDPITRDHVVRVGELTMRAGARLGLGAGRLRASGLAALLHDVGKLSTPREILAKPSRLTLAEFETIKEHAAAGEAMLARSPLLADAAPLVRWHHERPDGSGYPDGLRDERIPLEAALISVCDAWDAMTWSRHYRRGMTGERARVILRDGAGTQWKAGCVEVVLAELAECGPVATPAFERVGRRGRALSTDRGSETLEVCLDALPDQLREARAGDFSAH